ncbi:MAG TPA: HAMP domain-containing sensor histidine kinase [Alphaproteobacteria bacterium]|nr:HAMP domain-containing sensor histidine kinase [Alphaproteobacteria bacterium]
MDDTPTLSGMEVSRWTLAFNDPKFERQFQMSWTKLTTLTNKIWVTIGLGFYAVFTLLLLVFLPEYCHDFLWIRYEITIPLLLLTQIPVYFQSRFERILDPLYFIGMFLSFGTALFLFVVTHKDHHLIYLFEMATISAFGQHYNRVLFNRSLVFSVLAVSATVTAISIEPGLVPIPYVPAICAVFAHALVGVFSGYGREFFARRNYLTKQVFTAELARNADLAVEANAASEAKSRFLAIASHELRTPLNAIIGYTEAMQSGIYGPMADGRVRQAVTDIHGSGKRLLTIVEDVLELTNAAQGTVELEESVFDLAALIAEMQSAFESECAKKGIELYVIVDPGLPSLSADPRLVRRILSNLLSNALKYTNKGGEVWLTAGAVDDGALSIWIKDTGIGIAPDKLERAMEVFGQVEDDLNRRYEGIGIGLPLTRSLIELHGGSFSVESKVGRGTRVRLTFPAERIVAGEVPTPVPSSNAA